MSSLATPGRRERGVNEAAAPGPRTAPPFPIFLKLSGRACLVVGAGREGESKIASLLGAAADVRVVAPEATETVQQWAREGRLDWRARSFENTDLDGAFLAVVATSEREL